MEIKTVDFFVHILYSILYTLSPLLAICGIEVIKCKCLHIYAAILSVEWKPMYNLLSESQGEKKVLKL